MPKDMASTTQKSLGPYPAVVELANSRKWYPALFREKRDWVFLILDEKGELLCRHRSQRDVPEVFAHLATLARSSLREQHKL